MKLNHFDILGLLLITVVGAVVLLYDLGVTPPPYPWSDESEIAADAVDTLKHGLQLFYPGQLAGGSLAVWLEAGWMTLFGKDLLGLRLLNGLVNLTSAGLLYFLVCQLPFEQYRRQLALTSTLFFVISLWFLGLGRIATPNWSLVPLMTNLAFLCFWFGLNTQRQLYFWLTGLVLGLLFYGYAPGYFIPLVPVLFLGFVWVVRIQRLVHKGKIKSLVIVNLTLLIVAAPILIFFALNPDALLQRSAQLSDTNELTAGSILESTSHLLSTFGLWPNWLLQGNFIALAFNPLATVLFVIGLLVTLWRWQQPAYLFLLIWWGVMIAPVWLSRSASQGFIFEVWRRGVGAQSVSFILIAIGLMSLIVLPRIFNQKITGPKNPFFAGILATTIIASAGLNYWLFFERWANSGALEALFNQGPVRLVEWMEREGQADDLFLFPIRPNVSPTTRPELFTVRYLYDGAAMVALPKIEAKTIDKGLITNLKNGATTIRLMKPNRLELDPKGYFEYALAPYSQAITTAQLPDNYTLTTFHLQPQARFDFSLQLLDVLFGNQLRLIGQQIQPDQPTAGQTIGVALRWQLETDVSDNYNASLSLYDAQGFLWVKIDTPLLRDQDYATTQQWSSGQASTTYTTLPIPLDAPPGIYTLELTLYNAATNQPLSLPNQLTNSSTNQPSNQPTNQFTLSPIIELQSNPSPTNPNKLEISQPLDGSLHEQLKLLGLSQLQSTYRPGDEVNLSLWWQATAPMAQDIGLLLALVETDSEPVPLLATPQPLIFSYPTAEWQPQQPYRANYRLPLPATLTSGEYGLALRLVDLDTQTTLIDQLLSPLTIEAREHLFDAPALAQPVGVDFGDTIRLTSFAFSSPTSTTADNTEAVVKMQWQALTEIDESYKIFLHLLDSDGQIVAQIDTLPQQGNALTRSWLPDEIIEDDLSLIFPADSLSDDFRLIAGLYNEKTGERLLTSEGLDYVLLLENGY